MQPQNSMLSNNGVGVGLGIVTARKGSEDDVKVR